jgi:tRNA(Ile)-lysidine synthase
LHSKTVDTTIYAEEHSVSIQVAARELRYTWFNELINNSGNKRTFILTAHHGDDAIETSVMHFFRGTGIRGLTGIPERNNNIIRPLLPFSRDEIVQYATERKLSWVEDSSNISEKYTRNYIRHQLIPAAEKMFPAVKGNLLENIRRFSEVNEIFEQAILRIRKKLVIADGEGLKVPVAGLLNSQPLETIVFECFHPFGFHAAQVPELISLCSATSGKRITSSTHTVTRNRKWLLINAHQQQTEPSLIVIEDANETVEFSRGKLYFSYHKHPFHIHKNASMGLFDSSSIQFPLLLRKWKPGDYFYPFGMQKKKKIARFLIDQKVSVQEKENVYVLEMNKKILWIVGYRIDNRFRVTDSTKEALEVEVRGNGRL